MKTYSIVFLISLICGMPITLSAQNCSDGFESNSFTGWQGLKGTNTGNYTFSITSIGTNTPNFGIETSTIIPCSNSISNPTVYELLSAPGFGQYSARLGEVAVPGMVIEAITYSFIPTAADTNFLYVYSTYLQAPGHAAADNPYFIIGMLDQNGDTIPGSFYMYQTGSPSVAGFDTSQCSAALYFKPWTIRGVNLAPYVGQQVTLFAVNADCYYGGHYAYSYIDMDCDGVLNVPPVSPVTLSARSEYGSTYLWNTGASTPEIIVNNPVPNSIYTCTVTLPSYYSPPATTYTFIVTYKISGVTDVQESDKLSDKLFYPNPANSYLNFNESNKIKEVRIYDVTGQLVGVYKGDVSRIDLNHFSSGVFFVECKNTDDKIFVEKLIIQK